MEKNGLSEVITTLIIILLVLVAIGIIWVVVRNVVQGGSEQVGLSTSCLSVDIRAVSVVETTAGNYDVTLNRKSGGDAIGGVKVTLFSDTQNSGVLDFGIVLTPLETKTQTIATTNPVVGNANRLDFTPYLLDESGNEQICPQTNSFQF